jgi:virulence factor Mce-like protein
MSDRTRKRRDPTRLYPYLGIAAVVLVIAIVYVSYTAPNGLPLERSYGMTVDVPNANRLVRHSQVRIGGVRVGQVADIEAIPATASGPSHARVRLRLNQSVDPVPVDTRVLVRPVSVLGATYVELIPGAHAATVPDGGSLPLARSTERPELNDLLDVFDRATARRVQETLGATGNGLAGQGTALNRSLESMSRAIPALHDVSQALNSPTTRLPQLISRYAAFSAGLAGVSDELAGLVTNASETFGALEREHPALGDTIAQLPATERAVTSGIDLLKGPLDDLGDLMTDLRPAVRRLPTSMAAGAGVMRDGIPALEGVPAFTVNLRPALDALHAFSRRTQTSGVLRKIDELLRAAQPLFAQLAESESRCHGLALMFKNLGPTGGGMGTGEGPGLTTLVMSTLGANSEMTQRAEVADNLGMNYEPNNTAQECESGNEPYTDRQNLTNPVGLQRNATRESQPPPGVAERARDAGLWDLPEGAR